MKKLKVRPVFTIHDTDFMVDVDRQVLREAQRPVNEISFVNDMQDKQHCYELRFNTQSRGVHGESDSAMHLQIVQVPQMVELDPDGMAEKYGFQAEELKDKTDFEIIVDQEALNLRHQGVLPQVDIFGELFIIDLRLQELRHAKFFFPVISLRTMELTNDGSNYEAYYHPVMKQTVEIDPKILELPDYVVKIRLAGDIGLDPVSVARQFGIDEREFLRRYPIQKQLKAEIIPLSETHIPALIQRNREQLRREHEENARRIKPTYRHRFRS